MAKINGKDFLRPTPQDWDPTTGYERGKDDPAILELSPAQRRLWDEQVDEIRQKQREREDAEDAG